MIRIENPPVFIIGKDSQGDIKRRLKNVRLDRPIGHHHCIGLIIYGYIDLLGS